MWIDGAGLLALALGLFATALRRGQIPYFMDTLAQFYPLRYHAARLLHEGQWPLWNRTMCCGVPLLANPQWGLLYPLGWPFLAWPGPFWFTVSYPIHFAIGAWGVYAVVARAGGSRGGAWAGALAFLLNSLTLGRVAFGAHHLALAWLPWGWLAVQSMAAPGRLRASILGAALVVALQLLSGAPQIAFYAAMSYAALAFLLPPPDEGPNASYARAVWRRMVGLGAACLAGGALAAPQVLPTLAFLRECGRGEGLGVEAVLQGTLGTGGLVRAFFGGSAFPEDAESTAYFGPGWAFLAFLALALRPRRGAPYAALAVGCALFCHHALGPSLYRLFPGYSQFHDPKRVLTVGATALSALCGLGVSAVFDPSLRQRHGARRLRRCLGAALAAAAALQAATPWKSAEALANLNPALGWFVWPFGECGEAWRWIGPWAPIVLAFLCAYGAAARPELRRAAALAAVAGLAIHLWLFSAARNDLKMVRAEWIFPADRGAAFPREGRFFAFDPSLRYSYDYGALAVRLLPNAGAYYGLEDAQGYDAFKPKSYSRTIEAVNAGGLQLFPSHFGLITRLDSPLIEPLGVAHATGPENFPGLIRSLGGRAPFDPDRATSVGAETWLAAKNPQPLASLWTQAEWGDPFSAEGRSPQRRALMLDSDQPWSEFEWPEGRGEGRILQTAVWANRVEIEAAVPPGGAFLLLRDAFALGWRATIDERPAVVLRAEGMFRATPVPAGRHKVTFRYRPPGLLPGTAIGALGLLALAALAAAGIRKRSPGMRPEDESEAGQRRARAPSIP